MTDIEIARSVKGEDIKDIAKKLGLSKKNLVFYGNDKAKINYVPKKRKGKLVLVTAISPTPLGEGKTTVSIGLADAMNKLGKKVVAVLREPSMGPVFGIKGGATGGGRSQVIPMEAINLHFTGDFHAITSANNLLCSAIDNHIYFGNNLDFKTVLFKRCLDVNDRALRNVNIGRDESFTITAASEIMALLCLAKDLDDLKYRLGNIVVGLNSKNEFIYAKDLKVEGSMCVLLKDAIMPNLVQTLEGTPVIIHGGPFANIAHGCNSVMATNIGLDVGDYVITEAGFGADLGAEKFLDIKCRLNGLSPDTVVLVATIKALKYHGGVAKDLVLEPNDEALKAGLCNLERHISNLKKYGVNVVVCINKFSSDTKDEIKIVSDYCKKLGVTVSTSTAYVDGGEGAIDLANVVIENCEKDYDFSLIYEDNDIFKDKVLKVCREIYHAEGVNFSELALEKLSSFEANGIKDLPICIAKTQYSFSDDQKKVGAPVGFLVNVKDICLYNGAGFITVLLGDIMTMPGLSRVPSYEKIDLIDGEIVGLS